MRSTRGNRMIFKPKAGKRVQPGEYSILQGGGTDEHPDVLLGCNSCEYRHIIGDNHIISADGVVEPSVGAECGFHEWVKLENWSD